MQFEVIRSKNSIDPSPPTHPAPCILLVILLVLDTAAQSVQERRISCLLALESTENGTFFVEMASAAVQFLAAIEPERVQPEHQPVPISFFGSPQGPKIVNHEIPEGIKEAG